MLSNIFYALFPMKFIDSNDKTKRRIRLHKDMQSMIVKIHFTGKNKTSNASTVWCDEPYLVIEYGRKQDLHSSKIELFRAHAETATLD